MRSKRLLTLLLVLCLVFGCVAPAAAVTGGSEAYDGTVQASEQGGEETSSEQDLDMIVSEDGTLTRVPTLKDDTSKVVSGSETAIQGGGEQVAVPEQNEAASTVSENGQWVASAADKDVDVELKAELSESLAELREAANVFAADEIVSAFVVMEERPNVSFFGDINDVPLSSEANLQMQQNAVITAIEEDVLDGDELQVNHQFTYLANAFSITTEFGNLEEIAKLDGVAHVYLMPIYYPMAEDELVETEGYTPYTVSSGEMSGVPYVWDTAGFTGAGMTIAVVDTGLDLDHPSFAAAPKDPSLDVNDINKVLTELNAYDYMDYVGVTLTAEDLYYSEKVPYTLA